MSGCDASQSSEMMLSSSDTHGSPGPKLIREVAILYRRLDSDALPASMAATFDRVMATASEDAGQIEREGHCTRGNRKSIYAK
jgi:hypothetical protein